MGVPVNPKEHRKPGRTYSFAMNEYRWEEKLIWGANTHNCKLTALANDKFVFNFEGRTLEAIPEYVSLNILQSGTADQQLKTPDEQGRM